MNIWDSVQRGLEKASQEAARIAKQQRLRTSIDQLSRQLNDQHNSIVIRAVDLYNNNQLTQSELIPMCQELMSLHNQLIQAQNELKLIQSTPPPQQGMLPPVPGQTPISSVPPTLPALYPPAQDIPTVYAPPPPDYQFYSDPTLAAPTPPPPPPGMEPPTIGSLDTIAMEDSSAPAGPRLCFLCHTAILPGHAFCHNCGTPVGDLSSSYLSTSRASSPDALAAELQGTVRGSMYVPPPPPPPTDEYGTIATSEPERITPTAPPPPTDDETVRAPNPNPSGQPPNGGQ